MDPCEYLEKLLVFNSIQSKVFRVEGNYSGLPFESQHC